jgi:hypothetical protein
MKTRVEMILVVDGNPVAELLSPRVDNFFIFSRVKWLDPGFPARARALLDDDQTVEGLLEGIPVEVSAVLDELIEVRRVVKAEKS